MNNEDIMLQLDEYYVYNRGESRKPKTCKLSLFNMRKYFLVHNTLFIMLKIFIGFIFFGLPIYLFKKIINSNNIFHENIQNNTSYSYAGLPLIISVAVFLLYVVIVTISKVQMLCQNRLYFYLI